MKFGVGVDYSLKALIVMAERYPSSQPIRIEEIAASQGIPETYLRRLLIDLKHGGIVLTASACYEGVGNPECEEVFNMVDTPARFLQRLMDKEFFIPDQWCAQEVYQVMRRNPTWIFSEGVPGRKLERYHFHSVDSVEQLKKMGVATKRAVPFIWFKGMLEFEKQLSFLPQIDEEGEKEETELAEAIVAGVQ